MPNGYPNLQFALLFEGLSEDQVKASLQYFREETYAQGTMLFDANTPGDTVYVVLKGAIRISRVTSFGEETTLDIVGPGEVVGEMASIDGLPRSARATCLQDTSALTISSSKFEELIKGNQTIAFNLLRELTKRIRKADDIIVQRLEEQKNALEARYLRLHKLIEASKSINSTLDLDRLLGIILESAAQSIGADRGTLYLVDDIKKELWSKVLQGENIVEIRLPFGKGIAGYVAETGETVLLPDAYADPRFNPEIDKKSGYRTRTMLCTPMRNKDGKIIGVFQLLNKKCGEFDSEDVEFIDALSAHASVAIENARLAQQMVQNERLSAVGRMASTIIHDIKNPMGTLRVYAQVMKRKSGNEEAAKLADEMIRQVDRFVNMAQEILDFTRGVGASNFQILDFERVMNDVLNFIEKDLEKNNVQLIRQCEFTGKVRLDQDKITRVFYNIASNARDAMPDGGILTASTRQDGPFVRIEFKDTGIGMPEEVKKRIFEPFMTYGKKHGTGLGMSIVKKIIDDHKGTIDIESEEGKGTIVIIKLPIEQ
ncbi:MAG: GAF domain-containing protein [Bacteroidetes bacterium]|nr:GAF domain-containing protein [Bacteroidota bacterium]